MINTGISNINCSLFAVRCSLKKINMKNLLFLVTIISLWGCERAALPPDEIGDTEFNVSARVGTDTLQLQAGKNGYVFVPDNYTDTQGYMVLRGELRPKAGNGDRLTLEIWDLQPNRPASIVQADLNQNVLPLGDISVIIDSTTSQVRDSLAGEIYTFTASNSTGPYQWRTCNILQNATGSTFQITVTPNSPFNQCFVTLSRQGTNASLTNFFNFTFGDSCRFQWDYQAFPANGGIFTASNGWNIDSLTFYKRLNGSTRIDTSGARVFFSSNTFVYTDTINDLIAAEVIGNNNNCFSQVYRQNISSPSVLVPEVNYTYTVSPYLIRIPGNLTTTYQQRMVLTYTKANGRMYKSKAFTPQSTDGRTARITRSQAYQKGSDEAWRIFADLDLMLYEQTPSATPDSLRFKSGKFELGVGLPR